MEKLRQTYVRLCKDHHIEPQDTVLAQLKSLKIGKSGTAVLNLSTHSLSVKTCAVLGKILATDRIIRELKLADCMLTEDGVKAIAHGLSTNLACKKLDLKGNNIRGAATEAVGRMIRQNKTLLSVCLEWNSLGMLDNAFSVFCEGVGANANLQVLDLRNNQISHDGATELATALKRNTTIKVLDLRWNNVGLVGGRALLNCLQHNKTLCKLDLAGNNTPNDVIMAIDTAVGHNADRQTLSNEYLERTQLMTRELRSLKTDKKMQLNDMMNKLDIQENLLRKSQVSSAHKVGQLQEALDERRSAFNTLASKMSLAESEIALGETKINDLGALLTRSKQEYSELMNRHQSELKKEREDRATMEGKLAYELSEANDRCVRLEGKVDEMERKFRLQQEQMYDLREQLSQQQAEVKVKTAQFEEKLSAEKQKCKDSLKDAEEIKQKELTRLQQEYDHTERNLKERLQKLELNRIQLEEEISRVKSSSMNDKLQAEEQLMVAKQTIKSEEELRCKQLEEKLRMVQASKTDLEKHCSNQGSTISELQTKNSNLNLEVETLKRRIDELNTELAGKNNEMLAEVGKVRIELNQQITRLQAEHQSQSELLDRINKLDKQLSDEVHKHRDTTQSKDQELHSLAEKLRQKESEIMAMREDETQRASALQSAIMNYVHRPSYSPR